MIDVAIDGVGYNKFPIELSDEEFRALTTEMNAVLAPYLDYQPGINRRRRMFPPLSFPMSASP